MRSDATIPSGCKWPGRRQNGILGRERGCVNGNVLGVSPGEDSVCAGILQPLGVEDCVKIRPQEL